MKNFVTKYPHLSMGIIVIFWTSLGFFIGRLSAPQNLTYTSNTEEVVKCIEVLKKCDEGYGRTLELLKQSNRLLESVIE